MNAVIYVFWFKFNPVEVALNITLMLYVFISLRNIHIQHVQTRTIREAEHNRQEEEPQMTRKWSMETMVSNFKMPPSRT